MGNHDKKDNPEKLKQLAAEMLQGIVTGVISGLIVYLITR